MRKSQHKKKYVYKYIVIEQGHVLEDAITFFSEKKLPGIKWIAEDAARHEYNEYEGWNKEWPMTFKIYSDDETYIGECLIQLDCDPVFWASNLKIAKKDCRG